MTLSLEIRPEVEVRLAARAQSQGQSLVDFVQHLLEHEAASGASGSQALTGVEKAAALEAWAKSFPSDLPILSLESVSRENMYRRD
jgi:hypothetical protein